MWKYKEGKKSRVMQLLNNQDIPMTPDEKVYSSLGEKWG